MAWDFIGVTNVVESIATTITLSEPAGVAEGDLLLACIAYRIASATPLTLPAGWTLVGQQTVSNISGSSASAQGSGMMAYHVRGASAPSFVFTAPVAFNVALGRVAAYRGNTATPLDVASAFTTPLAQTSITAPGVTTTVANDIIVAMAAGGAESIWTNFRATTPSGGSGATTTATPSTTTWQQRQNSITVTGGDTSLAIFDAVKAAAGATGNCIVSGDQTASHVMIIGSFKMSATAPTGKSWVKQAGSWKQAVTHVKHAGTWKPATVHVKSGGVWKQVS